MIVRDERVFYNKTEFVETDTGNKVSRKSKIWGTQNIILGGKTIIQSSASIRGDLRRRGETHTVVVSIGRYCLLDDDCLIRPPYKTYKGAFSYYPVKIGDYVTIGAGSIVQAAQIGNLVEIGRDCVIGRFVIIKDGAKIKDNSVLAPGTVVPSFAVFAGSPGTFVEELPDGYPEMTETMARARYKNFVPLST